MEDGEREKVDIAVVREVVRAESSPGVSVWRICVIWEWVRMRGIVNCSKGGNEESNEESNEDSEESSEERTIGKRGVN